jgi:hypothetical protein
MEFVTLAYELFLLAIGVYMYLFAIGKVASKDPSVQKKANDFRARNKGWMRILGLALMAIMTVNIVLHIMQWG